MYTLKYFIFGTLIILLLSAVSCRSAAVEEASSVKNDNCIQSYSITRAASPWQGLTSSYEDEEASKKILSIPLQDSGYRSVLSIIGPGRNERYVIGRNDSLRRVAVDSSLFSDLNRADATRRTEGKFLIGTYRDIMFNVFTPAGLADILIESQIVNTYWHVESVFCLDSEEDSADAYTAHYKGKHIYFTNSKNEDPLDFSIIIDKKTGEMFLEVK